MIKEKQQDSSRLWPPSRTYEEWEQMHYRGFMITIHFNFVRLHTFFTLLQWFQGQFNIITLAIGALDEVTDDCLQYIGLSGLYLSSANLIWLLKHLRRIAHFQTDLVLDEVTGAALPDIIIQWALRWNTRIPNSFKENSLHVLISKALGKLDHGLVKWKVHSDL